MAKLSPFLFSIIAVVLAYCLYVPDVEFAYLEERYVAAGNYFILDDEITGLAGQLQGNGGKGVHVRVDAPALHTSCTAAQSDESAASEATSSSCAAFFQQKPRYIVLLHGTSSSLHTWEYWAQQLTTDTDADDDDAMDQQRTYVIRMDLPGFGLTGPRQDMDYSIEAYVNFVISVFDHVLGNNPVLAAPAAEEGSGHQPIPGKTPFIIAGNSLGGNIAASVAVAVPERVQQVILVDASGYGLPDTSTGVPKIKGPNPVMPLGFKLAQNSQLRPLLASILPWFVMVESVQFVYGDKSQVDTALVQRYFDLARRGGNRGAVVDRFASAKKGAVYDRKIIAANNIPTLIIWGELDLLTPIGIAELYRDDIPDAQLEVIPGAGHCPQEEAAEQSFTLLKRFIN